jgi:hypothetical protein
MQFPVYFPVYTYLPPFFSPSSPNQTSANITQAKIQQMCPNGEILSFNLGMHGLPEGKASRWNPCGNTVYFSFACGEINGDATFFNPSEGYEIIFKYVKGVPQGPAAQKWTDGRCKHFKYVDGISRDYVKQEPSDGMLKSNIHKKFEMLPSSTPSPTSPLHLSAEYPSSVNASPSVSFTLDSTLLRDFLFPKTTTHQSAYIHYYNGLETPFDVEKLIIRYLNLLKTNGLSISQFKIIGDALQGMILKQDKQVKAINFLGHLTKIDNSKVCIKDVYGTFSKVLEDELFKQKSETNELKSENKPKPQQHNLKSFFPNKEVVFATISLQRINPADPLQKIPFEVCFCFQITPLAHCISSADCFECNLLPLFQQDSPDKITVTAASGYNIQDAIELLKQGQFSVHVPHIDSTTHGIRLFASLLTKGIFPDDYPSARLYFQKWKQEYRDQVSSYKQIDLTVFFNSLTQFLTRQYNIYDINDIFSLCLYCINLRTLFDNQDWSSENKGWSDKDLFLRILDINITKILQLYISNITAEHLSLLQLVIFWHNARKNQEMLFISNSPNLFGIRNTQDGYGMMTRIPWESTLHCNWHKMEQHLENMQSYLQNMDLPESLQELLDAIREAVNNVHNPLLSVSERFGQYNTNSTFSNYEIQIKELFKIVCQREFNLGVVKALLDIIVNNSSNQKIHLRQAITLIHQFHPDHKFKNLWQVKSTHPILLQIRCLCIDVEDIENGQREICEYLLTEKCNHFQQKAFTTIFPHLKNTLVQKYCGDYLKRRELDLESSRKAENASLDISANTLQTMLKKTLESNLNTWDDLFLQKLPSILKEGVHNKVSHPLDPNFVNLIGDFFMSQNHLGALDITIQIEVLDNLLLLGYQSEKIKLLQDSFIKAEISNKK